MITQLTRGAAAAAAAVDSDRGGDRGDGGGGDDVDAGGAVHARDPPLTEAQREASGRGVTMAQGDQNVYHLYDSTERFGVPRAESNDTELLPLRVKQTPHGRMLYSINDVYIGWSWDLYGEWCLEELRVMMSVVQPGQVVLDVGAHIGSFAVPLAAHVGPTGMVIAFEPQRLNHAMLLANAHINGLRSLIPVRAAVGDHMGSVHVPELDWNEERNFGGIPLSWYAQEDGEMVPLVTVDSLNLTQCNFMKIDAESMELHVLRGALDTIKRLQPVIYMENEAVIRKQFEESDRLLLVMDSLGYVCYWIRAHLFRPGNAFGNKRLVWNEPYGVSSHNLLCSPSSAAVVTLDNERALLSGRTSLAHDEVMSEFLRGTIAESAPQDPLVTLLLVAARDP